MNGKVSVVFNRNSFSKMKDFKVTSSHKHCESGSLRNGARCTFLLYTTNRKYMYMYMAYWFVPFAMTLKVIRLLQGFSNTIWVKFLRHFAQVQLIKCIVWLISNSRASCNYWNMFWTTLNLINFSLVHSQPIPQISQKFIPFPQLYQLFVNRQTELNK